MNCLQHPDRTATAFCQSCGKALCPECVRTAEGLLLCEPCLLLRYPNAQVGAASPSGWSSVGTAAGGAAPFVDVAQGAYRPVAASSDPRGQVPVQSGASASPVLAGFLGAIPGVGAMYNGQFVKALIHVVVLVVLIEFADHFNAAGALVATWWVYQVFDAVQTASARRYGRPLPDPFGILEWSRRLGPQSAYPSVPVYAQPVYTQPVTQGPIVGAPGPVSSPYVPLAAPVQPTFQGAGECRRGEPIGAIVLIVVGLLLLLSTLGFLNVNWLDRGWPALILLLGVWLLVRRVQQTNVAAPKSTPAPTPTLARNPLSIQPDPEPAPAPNAPQENTAEQNEENGR